MDTMIGVDLAKSVYQVHGASMTGEVKFRKKLTRSQFLRFMSDHDPAIVVMEACGGARFCRLVRDCVTSAFVWRQATAWKDIKGGAGGHQEPAQMAVT